MTDTPSSLLPSQRPPVESVPYSGSELTGIWLMIISGVGAFVSIVLGVLMITQDTGELSIEWEKSGDGQDLGWFWGHGFAILVIGLLLSLILFALGAILQELSKP